MVRKICNVVSLVLVAVMGAVALVLVVPYLFGYRPLAVLSGSMEPTYPVGSVIFVKHVDPEEIAVGQAISFQMDSGAVATHRVVAISTQNKTFTTKGDANNNQDNPIAFKKLIGRASPTAIPLIGFISVYIRTPAGILVMTALIVAILLLIFLPELLHGTLGQRKQETAEEATPGPNGSEG